MYAISTNWCLNQLRNRRGRSGKLERRADELIPVAPGELPDEDRQRLLALIGEVDEETQKCVVYTWFDDCSREEVARLVGISVPTVRKRLNQFLDLARSRWGIVAAAVIAMFLLPMLLPGGAP
jgi:DNA-directed RNA polymerase specialized sigma24 family protein